MEVIIATPGGVARFNCLSLMGNLVGVEWLVNGTQLENLNLSNAITEFDEETGGVLTLTNLPVEYNMTRIIIMYTHWNIPSCSSQYDLHSTITRLTAWACL